MIVAASLLQKYNVKPMEFIFIIYVKLKLFILEQEFMDFQIKINYRHFIVMLILYNKSPIIIYEILIVFVYILLLK